MQEKFEELGYDVVCAGDIPGFYTVLDTGRPGPQILILGELDSVICPNHKDADAETGCVHACGHNAQCVALLGVAAALKEPQVCDKLCGKIRLCAVPAEELIEIAFRTDLRSKGIIKYFGGKSEFLYRGYFDGVDMAFMVHTARDFYVNDGSVGCIAKTAHYKGVSAHAGICPWDGKNAIYAATQGMSAANAIRETFEEKDIIRFYPIITHGGEIPSAIPELVTLESFVRGKTFKAIENANAKINRALCGAALSLGVNIEILDTPGYAPLINCQDLVELTKEAADAIIPEEKFFIDHFTLSGSTDMGELCGLMPVVHPYAGGETGIPHGEDYYIEDAERACVKSAKMQIAMLLLLLRDNAKRANEIIAAFEPQFASKEEYFAYVDNINSQGDRIEYSGGIAKVKVD